MNNPVKLRRPPVPQPLDKTRSQWQEAQRSKLPVMYYPYSALLRHSLLARTKVSCYGCREADF